MRWMVGRSVWSKWKTLNILLLLLFIRNKVKNASDSKSLMRNICLWSKRVHISPPHQKPLVLNGIFKTDKNLNKIKFICQPLAWQAEQVTHLGASKSGQNLLYITFEWHFTLDFRCCNTRRNCLTYTWIFTFPCKRNIVLKFRERIFVLPGKWKLP